MDHDGSVRRISGPNLVIGSHGVKQGASPRRTSSGSISDRWMLKIQEETDKQTEDPLYRRPMYYLKEIPPKQRPQAKSDAYPVEQQQQLSKEVPVEVSNVKLPPKPPDAKASEPQTEAESDWPSRSLPSPLKDNIFLRRDSDPASPSGGSDGAEQHAREASSPKAKLLPENAFLRRDSKSKLLENPFLQRDSLSSHSSRSSGMQPAEKNPVSPKPAAILIDCPTPSLKDNPFLKASTISAPPAHARPPVAHLSPTLPAVSPPRPAPNEPAPASSQVLLFHMDEPEGGYGCAESRHEELAPLLEGSAHATPSKVLKEPTPKALKVNILPEFSFSDKGDAEEPPMVPNGGDATTIAAGVPGCDAAALEARPLNLPPLPLPWPDADEGQSKSGAGSDALTSGAGSSAALAAAPERGQDKAPLQHKRPSLGDRLFSRRPSQGK